MDKMTPDTTLALMKAAQDQSAQNAKNIKDSARQKELKQIEETAQDFEAMFITEMMKPMFEGVKPDPMFGGGKGEEVFQGFMLQEYGKLMAQTGQLGIAEAVKEEMIRMQEAADASKQTDIIESESE